MSWKTKEGRSATSIYRHGCAHDATPATVTGAPTYHRRYCFSVRSVRRPAIEFAHSLSSTFARSGETGDMPSRRQVSR